MAQVYFHCTNAEGVWFDRRGAAIGNLAGQGTMPPSWCGRS